MVIRANCVKLSCDLKSIAFASKTVLWGSEEKTGEVWHHHRHQLFYQDEEHRNQASRWALCFSESTQHFNSRVKWMKCENKQLLSVLQWAASCFPRRPCPVWELLRDREVHEWQPPDSLCRRGWPNKVWMSPHFQEEALLLKISLPLENKTITQKQRFSQIHCSGLLIIQLLNGWTSAQTAVKSLNQQLLMRVSIWFIHSISWGVNNVE